MDGGPRHLAVAPDPALVDLPRLPGPESLAELLREARRVGGGAEGLPRETPDRLVVLPPALPLEGEREDHVGPEGPHDADDVTERLLAPPLREGLLDAEREAELECPPEELLDPVEPVEGHQLAGPQDAERLEQLRPDRVLAALAPGDGEERGAQAEAAREAHEDAVHLVVGVGGHVEHTARDPHPPEGEGGAARAAVEVERLAGAAARPARAAHEEPEGHGNGENAPTRAHGCLRAPPPTVPGDEAIVVASAP